MIRETARIPAGKRGDSQGTGIGRYAAGAGAGPAYTEEVIVMGSGKNRDGSRIVLNMYWGYVASVDIGGVYHA